MNTHINHQVIRDADGYPAFVVVPYDEYIRQYDRANDLVPNEVVGRIVMNGLTPTRAWREHLGLTQEEVANRAGMTQAALSQIESGGHKPRKTTLEKLAVALGITIEQLSC